MIDVDSLPVTRLTLLGTAGGPGAEISRSGIASLVSVAGHNYLIDAGSGVARQLARAGLSERDIPITFLTHLHDDHTAGLPELMTFAYTMRSPGMLVIGPPQTSRLISAATDMLQVSAEIRMAENNLPQPPSAVFSARDAEPGVIHHDDHVRVTAVYNTHFHFEPGQLVERNRSFAFRFDTADRSIVFTGDTGESAEVEKLARAADILVAEVVTPEAIASVPEFVREHMVREHLSLSQVGQLAARAEVATLVLSHCPVLTEEHLALVRAEFSGRIVAGEDLQQL